MTTFSPSGFYMSFSGSAGIQFGRNIFTTNMPFSAVARFLVVFEDVQRQLNKTRVKSIASYILKGLKQDNYCFLSAVTATCRGAIKYEASTHTVSIDINSNLSINDGQHRVEAIKLAIATLQKESERATGSEREMVSEKLRRLEEMCIPVVIFDNMSMMHEQQLFHDLNLLASKPTKSVSLKFDNTDLYNRMAKELAVSNEYLLKYGIEAERTSLRDTNQELMVLSTLRNMISFIIAGTDKDKQNVLTEDNYDEWYYEISKDFNKIFNALPVDYNNRNKYIIGLAATLQGIGKYVHYLINDNDILEKDDYLQALGDIDWRHSNPLLNGYGGSYDRNKGKFVFGGTGGGINGIFAFLKEYNRIF